MQCVVQRVVSDFPRDFSCCRMVCSCFSILAKLSSTEADRDDNDFSRSRTLMQRRCSRSFASSFSLSITFVWCVTALSSSLIFKESRSSLSLASFLSLSTQRESVSTFCTRGCGRSLHKCVALAHQSHWLPHLAVTSFQRFVYLVLLPPSWYKS